MWERKVSRHPKMRVSMLCLPLALICVILQSLGLAAQARSATYSFTTLGFRYTPPLGLRDKTESFRVEVAQRARLEGKFRRLNALLAMSSVAASNDPHWGSVTIESYPRRAVSESDDSKAALQMNAWVAHSREATALPESPVISGQTFTVSVFGLREGSVTKGAVVWTTVRKGRLLAFAFAANSPEVLERLTETIKRVQFY